MNHRHILSGVPALILAILLNGCIQPTHPIVEEDTLTSTTTQAVVTEAAPVFIYQSMKYAYQTDVSGALDAIVTGLDPTYLITINRDNLLDADYVPSERTDLTCPTYNGKNVSLESRAATALYAMLAEMKADGVTDIAVTSGYRTYEYQQQLHTQYLNKEKSKITPDAYAYFGEEYIQTHYLDKGLSRLSEEDALKVVMSYSALPGASEHQSGLCVDFVTSSAMLTQSFENTDAFDWLSQNAYRFGYILRYPEDKTEITGFSYEPWHFRFVGREAATELYFRNLVLEELSGIF